MPTAKKVFDEAAQKRLAEAVKEAELHTSGEIRLVVEDNCPTDDAYDRALELFGEMNMHETAEENGVLIYLALRSHKFSILGDKGIHEKLPEGFWGEIRDNMRAAFRQGHYVEGLETAIVASGKALGDYFPRQDDDQNELPDDVVIR